MLLAISLADILALTFCLVLLAIAVIFISLDWWRQFHCKHDKGVNETSACEAICRGCGKNLGFIGDWRKDKK